MTSKKRQRDNARRKQAQLEAKHHARAARRDQRVRVGIAVASGLVVIGLASWAVIALMADGDTSSQETTAASPDATTTPEATSSSDSAEADDDLEYATGWSTSPTAPDPSLSEDRTWTATLTTNQGDIVIEIDGEAAPQATSSFVALAGDSFYHQSECHRLTTSGIYVLQCGAPATVGVDGPNYRFGPIENAPEDDFYPAGTVAMARVANDAESMGSQFFIVYEDSTIPSDTAGGYTVFGQVTQGLSIVEGVASAGTITGEPDGPPAQSVIVNEVSVE